MIPRRARRMALTKRRSMAGGTWVSREQTWAMRRA